MRIEGDGVTLRGFRPEELDRLVEVTAAWPAWVARDRDGLARKIEASGRWTDVAAMDLAIEAEGSLAGEVQARQPRGVLPPGVFELGIEIYDPADRGRGLGTAAVRAIVAHLFEHEEAHRVQLSTDVANDQMRRCAEHVGFELEGVNRAFMPSDAGPRDHAMYGMTRTDFEEVEPRWT